MNCNDYYVHTPDGHGDYLTYGPFSAYQAQACLVGQFQASAHPHSTAFSIKRAALIMSLFDEHHITYLPLELNIGEYLWITKGPLSTYQKSLQPSSASSRPEPSHNDQTPLFFVPGVADTSMATPTPVHTVG